jgi:hypothetical protein
VTLTLLLSLFERFSSQELNACTPSVKAVALSLPADPSTYENLVDEAMPEALRDPLEADLLARLAVILEILLEVDGRSERALLRIVDCAVTAQGDADTLAVAPLAALNRYYSRHGPSPDLMPELLNMLDAYAAKDALFVNALACKRSILRWANSAPADLARRQDRSPDRNIVRQGDRTIFFRDKTNARSEYILPSGATIVDDLEEGLSERFEIRTRFDWDTAIPGGPELTEPKALRWPSSVYVIRYQQHHDEHGFVKETRMRLVEEYVGATRMRVQEYDKIIATPRHLRGHNA